MKHWLRALVLALVFAAVGAFATSLWVEVRHDRALSPDEPASEWQGRRIRVEVLNGAGVDQLARRATDRLRAQGFDVVYYGNAEEFDRDSSVVIARVESPQPARRVADALGLHRVERQLDRDLSLDVTVVLGKDWTGGGTKEDEIDRLDVWWSRIRRAAARFWPD